MLSAVLQTLRERTLVAPGDRVLVGLSGGPDSVALLLALRHLAPRLRIEVRAATIDHGLRPSSASEAAEVVARCAGWGITCAVERVDVRAARGPHVSWQDAARRARLGALESLAARDGCARIALGHTADDQAETVLFRILRGTGVAGLSGIPYQRGPFVRPLLDVRRAQVEAYLRKRKVTWFEDPSNADRRFTRARLRHDLLPLLRRENPRVVEALLALAGDARGETAGAVPPRLAASVRRLATRGGSAGLDVPGGRIEVNYGAVTFRAGPTPAVAPVTTVLVPGPGIYRTSDEGPAIAIREVDVGKAGGVSVDRAVSLFDATDLPFPWTVRAVAPGDRMRPRGGGVSRKLQDLLVDAKVPRDRRRFLPVLLARDGTILFIPGLRPAERAKPSSHSRHLIEVSVL